MSDDKKKSVGLTWEDFIKLGNPENAPELQEETDQEEMDTSVIIRIHLEKKGRNGKTVSIVKGVPGDTKYLKDISKELKSACGVGGSCKEGIIIIQGNHREKIKEIFIKKGFKNVKLAGG